LNNKILYEKENNISWIIFNREDKLNALDFDTWSQLRDSLIKADNDDTNVIVLTGKGRAFSAGDDIYSMYNLSNPQESELFFENLFAAIDAILNLSKPLISAVNGLAYGGGCEILLLSDIVIAVNDAKFSISEGKLGLIPPMASAIGYKALGRRIMRLLLTAEEIDAKEAKEIGIVDYIVPKEELNSKILEIVKLINNLDKNSIKSIKNWTRIDRKMIEKAVRELSFMCLTSPAKERMRKFIEKRNKLT